MNEYGLSQQPLSHNKKPTLKSPLKTQHLLSPISLKTIDQSKHFTKKFKQVQQQLTSQHSYNIQLQLKLKQLEELFIKKQKQIQKKESIHEILLEQIEKLKIKKNQIVLLEKQKQKSVNKTKDTTTMGNNHSKKDNSNSNVNGKYIGNNNIINKGYNHIKDFSVSSISQYQQSFQQLGGYFQRVLK